MDSYSTPAIDIKDLKFRFSLASGYVLDGLNFKVYPGEIVGYIGPNGAGKTTTIKLILNLLEFVEGSITVLGTNIKEDKTEYKYKIGYVPEHGELYDNLTGYELLKFFGEIYKVDEEALEKKIIKMTLLYKINENLHERISSYSKGMKQKLLIICSLLHNPDILFFDEPLNGLDANSVQIFKDIISMLAKEGKTIFYSSHIMDVVEKISDRIILLNKGRVVADGTFEELKAQNETGSLEGIFNTLTGFNESEEIASDFVESIKG